MLVVDEAAAMRGHAEDEFAFMQSALCHDLGKPVSTTMRYRRIVSYGRENAGAHISAALLDRIVGSSKTKGHVLNMMELRLAGAPKAEAPRHCLWYYGKLKKDGM